MSKQTRTTLLELVGVLLIVAFAAVVWWPSALLVAGLACLAASWSLTGATRTPAPKKNQERRR